MPFPQQQARPFTREAVLRLNPGQNGCYGIYVANGHWVYVGSGDIRQRMLDHVGGDNACITGERPTHWVSIVTDDYVAEEKRLILEHKPHCNKKVG
jgi:hypothetical protein